MQITRTSSIHLVQQSPLRELETVNCLDKQSLKYSITDELRFTNVKTKTQISCAVVAQLIGVCVFASWIAQFLPGLKSEISSF